MTEARLSPRSVTISSELKTFSKERGGTDGSFVSVSYDVPEGTKHGDLAALTLREKRSLDLLVLHMERMKGVLSDEFYSARVDAIRKNYDNALKGKLEPEK